MAKQIYYPKQSGTQKKEVITPKVNNGRGGGSSYRGSGSGCSSCGKKSK